LGQTCNSSLRTYYLGATDEFFPLHMAFMRSAYVSAISPFIPRGFFELRSFFQASPRKNLVRVGTLLRHYIISHHVHTYKNNIQEHSLNDVTATV